LLKNYRGKKRPSYISFFTLITMLCVLGGCTATDKQYYLRPGADMSSIKRIAVLPLETLTQDEYAGEKIRRMVMSELLARGVDVIEPGEVTSFLRTLQKPLNRLEKKDIRDLGEKLEVGAVMMGSVEAYKMASGLTVPYPEVSITLRLVEPISGNVIWSAVSTSCGASFWTRHFGTEGLSLSETARRVVKDAVDTLLLTDKTIL
jgi:TolB-like protein